MDDESVAGGADPAGRSRKSGGAASTDRAKCTQGVTNPVSRLLGRRAVPWWLVVVGILIGAVLGGSFVILTSPSSGTPIADLVTHLQGLAGGALGDEKTRREVIAIELANRTAASPWASILALVPISGAVIAIITISATIWKQITDRSDERRRELADRERENQRRFSEAFQATVTNLAAPSAALRASAAVSLGTFLRPEYASYHESVILVAIAKAKEGMEDDPTVRRLVARALEQGLRARLPDIAPYERRYFLDLAHAQLEGVDLSGLDLSEADMGFANMRRATLRGARLYRAKGYEVHLEGARMSGRDTDLREARLRKAHAEEAQFHDANLVSIRLEEAGLQRAEFQGARLQEAHFQGADLRGARFEGSDVTNAYFTGATLDAASGRSLTRARGWRSAHFDDVQKALLPETDDASTVDMPANDAKGG